MDFVTALMGAPAPTLLMIGGLLLLLLGLVTFKKPIVIEVTPANRKLARIFGVILIGISIFLLSLQTPDNPVDETLAVTPTQETEIPTPHTPIAQDTLSITNTPSVIPSPFFVNDCISSDNWLASSSTNYRVTKDNCLELSNNGIVASNGDLLINIQSKSPKVSTIYMPILETSIIKFKVRIDKFSSGENGNLAFGIGGENCKITDGEFIFYRSTNSQIFVVSGYSALEYGDTLGKYTLSSTDSLEFHVNKSTFEIYLNDIKVKTGVTTTTKPTFCISYRFPEHIDLSLAVSDFSIDK